MEFGNGLNVSLMKYLYGISPLILRALKHPLLLVLFVLATFVAGIGIEKATKSQNNDRRSVLKLDSVNNAGVRFVSPGSYNWSATLSGEHLSGAQTLTFTEGCPPGVFGNDPNLWIMVNDDTEVAASTAKGTCVPGESGGTVTFNLVGVYANPQISSASSGVYEALVDAQAQGGAGDLRSNFHIVFGPTNPPSGPGALYYSIYAPVTVPNGIADIDGSGASIDCESLDQCFKITRVGEMTIHGFRFWTSRASSDSAITQTSCASNFSTITTTLNPPIGSWVDVQNTDSPHYWGIHQVATSSPSGWTFSDKNCGGLITIPAVLTPGGNAREHSAINDTNGQGVTLRDIYFDAPNKAKGAFSSLVVVIADQDFEADHIFAGSRLLCDDVYCGQAFYGPGNFVSGPAIGFLSNANMSFACSGNGIKWMSGNGLTVQNSVIQAFSEFAVMSGNLRGGFGKTTENFLYNEIGACANPLYTGVGLSGICGGSPSSGCSASGTEMTSGVLVSAGDIPGMSGSTDGAIPSFASKGATTYAYYLIIQDGSKVSMPLLFGNAAPENSSSYKIGWPRYASPTNGTVTYHVLRMTGAGYRLSAPIADGVPRSISLTQSPIPQCRGQICTMSDSADTNLEAYPVSTTPELTPTLLNWPGSIILGRGAKAYVDDVADVVTTTMGEPSVFAKRCSAPTAGINIVCVSGDSVVNNNPAVGALMLKEGRNVGGDASNLTGRLTFQYSPAGSSASTELITLVPAAPGAILADPNHRPVANGKDTWLGLDTGSVGLSSAGLAGSAPTSIDWCIGQTPADCKTNAIQRLTSSRSAFSVPVVTPAVISSGAVFKSNSGCKETDLVGAATAGSFRAGVKKCSTTITIGAAAPDGWACSVWDLTTLSGDLKQVASTTSSVTFSGTVIPGDKIIFACQGF